MNMIKIINGDQRHFNDFGWLKTYWLFSFSDYHDPENIQFGALRVFNDDVVAPNTGFSTHPHREMEIITIVLDGELTHEDSMGNKTVIRTNEVQCMSAGTGITHSEFNRSDKPLHLYQIWIFPRERGLEPSYDQKSYVPSSWENVLCPLASGQDISGAVKIHADATIYRANLEKGRSLHFNASHGRGVFIYLKNGSLTINNQQLEESGQARIEFDGSLDIEAHDHSDFILIDVPKIDGHI
jgi:redox-sensitive bicupin YhaK (pirin superfamily)